jgi:hypothetical protein
MGNNPNSETKSTTISSRDSFAASSFYSKCDNISNTVIIIINNIKLSIWMIYISTIDI